MMNVLEVRKRIKRLLEQIELSTGQKKYKGGMLNARSGGIGG